MKKLGMILLAVMAVNSAVGANWMKTGEATDKAFIHSLDIDSVRKLNTYTKQISYFIKKDLSKAEKAADGKYYNYAVAQWKGDCENNRISLMGFIYYSKNGSVVDSYNIPYDDWQPAFPDTIGEAQLNAACYVAGYRDTP